MAMIYLASGDQVDIYGAAGVRGASGRERILLHDGAGDVTVSAAVEETHFALDAARYDLAGVSGRLEAWKDGVRVASIVAADGLEARFADGGAVLSVDPATGAVLLGGSPLGTAPAPFLGSLDPGRASILAQDTPDPAPPDPSVPDRLETNDTAPSATSLVGIRAGGLDGLTIHGRDDADFFKIRLDSPGTADNVVRIDFADASNARIGVRISASDGPDLPIVPQDTAASRIFGLEGLEAGVYVIRVESDGGSPAAYSLCWNTVGVPAPPAPDPAPEARSRTLSEFAVGDGMALVIGMAGLDAGMFDVFANGDADGDGHDDVDGTGPSLIGPQVVDAEKGADPLGADNDMCWAAAAANALALTGWGELGLETAGLRDASIPLEDDILDLFRENHDPGSGFEYQAFEWFFAWTGLSMTGLSYVETPAGPDAMSAIEDALRDGRAVTLGIRGRLGGTGLNHAVTCCGIRWDPSRDAADPERFTGICIVDSDDDRSHDNPVDTPNRMTLVDCSYDADRGCWFLDSYAQRQVVGGGIMLESVTEINAWPGLAGVPAQGVPDAA